MKHLFTLFVVVAFALGATAQTIEILPQYGYCYPGGAEVDLNNDGYQDLMIGGQAKTTSFVEDSDGNQVETDHTTQVLMFDPTSKTYSSITTNVLNSVRAHFIFADFNGDGIMDLVAAEHDLGVLYGGGIYEGKGDGTFEKKTPTFSDSAYPFQPVAVAVADFNNDALPDIVAIGYNTVNSVVVYSSAVLINKGNYQFDVTATDVLQEYQLALVTVKVLDYNNDGYMDFFVSGNCDNKESNGGARVLADIFANLGEEGPGEFYRLSLGDGVILQKANGGLDIADLNSDGWLDFAIHGEGGEGTGEPETGSWVCISHVYMNNKSGSFTEKTQPNFSADLRPLNSSGNSTRVFDWNGDGYPDDFIPGWNPSPETGTQAGFYFLNDGQGTFGTANRIPGGSEISIFFPDWNGDGIKDYFMTGQSWDATYFTGDNQGRTAAVVINNSGVVNERPTAPSNLTATVSGSSVTLSWSAGSDSKTPANGLSYEYYLKDSNGKIYNNCRSFIGGDHDGIRKVMDLGNAMMNKTIKLQDLPDGTYQWGVQAIDASFDGSIFANGTSFTIGGNSAAPAIKADELVSLNVTRNMLNLNCKSSAKMDIYTLSGALLISKDHLTSYSANLNNGAYIVRIIINNEQVIRKITVR